MSAKDAGSLLLASGSPRRCDLLRAAGYHFKVVRPAIDERSDRHLTLGEITLWNAVRKGISVARLHPTTIVIAADTLVSLDGEIIGKPADLAEALVILRKLNGRTHQVCTGVFVGRRADSRFNIFREVSQVTFRQLSDQGLRDYLSAVDPLDKAGAYAAQEKGAEIIANIEGSRSNVIGLPMKRTAAALQDFGIKPRLP